MWTRAPTSAKQRKPENNPEIRKTTTATKFHSNREILSGVGRRGRALGEGGRGRRRGRRKLNEECMASALPFHSTRPFHFNMAMNQFLLPPSPPPRSPPPRTRFTHSAIVDSIFLVYCPFLPNFDSIFLLSFFLSFFFLLRFWFCCCVEKKKILQDAPHERIDLSDLIWSDYILNAFAFASSSPSPPPLPSSFVDGSFIYRLRLRLTLTQVALKMTTGMFLEESSLHHPTSARFWWQFDWKCCWGEGGGETFQ